MYEFESYLKSNCNSSKAVACGIDYSYSQSTNKNVIIHVITVKLTWTDRDANPILNQKLIFRNDTLTKASEKHLKTINPSELTNKFRLAKPYIVKQLIRSKQEKIAELQMDVDVMCSYLGSNSDIIHPTQKNTVHLTDQPQPVHPSVKTAFDM